MRTFAWICMLLGMVVVFSACGSEEAPAPGPATPPSSDAPDVQLPDESSPAPPPAAPTFEDDAAVPSEPAAGPALGDPGAAPADLPAAEPAAVPAPSDPGMAMGMGNTAAPAEPASDDSAASTEKPSVTKAFGTALFKGITQGASGTP